MYRFLFYFPFFLSFLSFLFSDFFFAYYRIFVFSSSILWIFVQNLGVVNFPHLCRKYIYVYTYKGCCPHSLFDCVQVLYVHENVYLYAWFMVSTQKKRLNNDTHNMQTIFMIWHIYRENIAKMSRKVDWYFFLSSQLLLFFFCKSALWFSRLRTLEYNKIFINMVFLFKFFFEDLKVKILI